MVVLSKCVTSFAALSTLLATVMGSPIESKEHLEARQSNFYPITGPSVGGVQPRLEIRTLAKDPIMLNLLMLSLIKFHAMDQKDKLSYYQLSGTYLPKGILPAVNRIY